MIIEKQLKILDSILEKYINSDISTKDVISIIKSSSKVNKSLEIIVSECSIGKEINKMVYLDTLDRIESAKTKRFLNTFIFINNYKIVNEQEEDIEDELESIDLIDNEKESDNLSTVVDDIDKMFFRELKQQPNLSEEETVELIKKYKETGDIKYKNQIISSHLKLVIYIAKRYIGRAELLDLIQEGSIGFGKAIEKFSFDKGCKLSTYSTWWIRQSITRYLEEKEELIRKPSHVSQNIKRLNYAIKKYQNENSGLEPSLEEISEITGFDLETIKKLRSYDVSNVSLNKEVGDDSDGDVTELMDFVADEDSEKEIYQNATNNDLKRELSDVFDIVFPIDIERSSKRDSNIKMRKVLTHRFGLFGESPKTLEEVAPLLHVTRERVRQIEAKGLLRLRRSRDAKSLKLFLDE